jgi:hypothetical protein
MRPIVFLVGILAAVGGVVGYLKTRNAVDPKKADAAVKEWAEDAIAPVKKVDCPDGKTTPGSVLLCAVTFESGQGYTAKVTFHDEGLYTMEWATPIIGAEKLAADIASDETSATKKDFKVDCGKGVVEIPADGLVCAASAGGANGHFRVKLDAKNHDVMWAPEP